MAEQLELFENKGPRVELIDFTGKGRKDERWRAAHLLMFTKATRLELKPGLMAEIEAMSEKAKTEQLAYMATTIPSSWEFADLTFLISGVTRAAAQQITRTRTASFAMQSQRVVDVRDAAVTNPFEPSDPNHDDFEAIANCALEGYQHLIKNGATRQNARGVLPMNVTTNLVAKYNLRSFADLVAARESLRTQSEYAEVVAQMKSAVLSVWPWAEAFLRPRHATAVAELDKLVQQVGLATGHGVGWQLAKIADLLRK